MRNIVFATGLFLLSSGSGMTAESAPPFSLKPQTPERHRVIVPIQPGDGVADASPTGRGIGTVLHHGLPGQSGAGQDNSINFHGGPVMVAPKTVYFIWYGNWSNDTAPAILADFASHLGGSSYFNTNASYADGQGNHIVNAVAYGGAVGDNYSQGKALSDDAFISIVTGAFANGLPSDPQGIYFVMTSKDVDVTSGFCSQYCGWHNVALIGAAHIKYSFVGDARRCPASCSPQKVSPNGNVGADAMVSIFAHELSEAVTDPELNAWYNGMGQENGDLCAWNFGKMQSLSNGARYNLTFGSRNYLTQEIWVNGNGGYCAMSYP